jgi:hypothetical protein
VEKRKKGDVLRKASAEGSAARARALTSVFAMMQFVMEVVLVVMFTQWELWRCGDACHTDYPKIYRFL